jgi:hypothetical protein
MRTACGATAESVTCYETKSAKSQANKNKPTNSSQQNAPAVLKKRRD